MSFTVAHGLSLLAEGTTITAGNLIVYRVGDGVNPLTNAATAVFLDEYTTTGTFVQSIPLPTTGAASLTAVGTATSEGIITPSQDGTSLIFVGYRKDVGGANPSSDNASVTNRVIASVGVSGIVNTSIALTEGTNTVRGATTIDGSTYYVSTATGIRYLATPGPASTSVVIDTRNSREVILIDNTLYASNGAAIAPKLQSYGTLPTSSTTATPLVSLATTAAVNSFSLFDLSSTVPGVDTAYLVDAAASLLYKFSFDGSVWNLNGSLASGSAQNVGGYLSGGTVNLFLSSPGSLIPYVDTSGYNSFDSLSTLGTAIATASTNTAFRGVVVAVPEPSAAIMFGLVSGAVLGLRRHRRAEAVV